MDAHDEKTQEQPGRDEEPRRLYRSQSDRVIGGVCGGIARYFGTDSTLIRIAAVALTLLGGSGLLLYIAGMLLMPAAPDAEPPVKAGGPTRTGTVVAIVVLILVGWPLILGAALAVAGLVVPIALLALAGLVTWWLVSGEGASGGGAGDVARRAGLGLGILIACFALFVAGAWAAAIGGGTAAAAVVIGAGAVLVVAAIAGRGRVRWLVLPALTLALGVGFSSAAGIDLHGGVGSRSYSPASADQLRDRYQLGMGQLVVDLRNAELPRGDTPLDLKLGVGSAEVYVPEDVCVATKARIGMGALELFSGDDGGVDVDWDDRPAAPPDGKRLVVDADVGVGALQVHHNREAGHHGPPFGRRHYDDESNTGCART